MLKSSIRKYRAGVSLLALAVLLAGGYVANRVRVLSADPAGDKDCAIAPQSVVYPQATPPRAIAPSADLTWSQVGGSINDASCVNKTDVYGIVAVRKVEDISRALVFARANGLTVSAAGVRHSMGGQAFRRGGVVLDLREFNRITVNEAARTVTVQPGASWHDIQNVLHPRFAVRAMQSTDIFTVGGSISVNAHGMDHQAGAMARSIRSLKVMLADGTIQDCSPTQNSELFNLVIGGYGLFGIIVEAELTITDNPVYRTDRHTMDYKEFPAFFASKLEPDTSVALMYGHLSTAPSSLLREMLLYTYTQVEAPGAERSPLGEPAATRMRRLVINLAKGGTLFKELKWFSEKHVEHRIETCTVSRTQAMTAAEGCFVSRNDPMHDSVPYLRNSVPNDTDILHEYFVPRERFAAFVDGVREAVVRNDANLLNASVRIVHKEENFLTYAPGPAFALVLYFNQTTDDAGNARMKKLTEDLIELTLAHSGRFFLPYQLYYSRDQLARSYPQIGDFFAMKRKYDPDETFSNTFYQKYAARS